VMFQSPLISSVVMMFVCFCLLTFAVNVTAKVNGIGVWSRGRAETASERFVVNGAIEPQ
jgi:hypothetical protein